MRKIDEGYAKGVPIFIEGKQTTKYKSPHSPSAVGLQGTNKQQGSEEKKLTLG
jgi:hypothetical protein